MDDHRAGTPRSTSEVQRLGCVKYRFSRSASNTGRFLRDRALRMILPRSTASCWLAGTRA